MNVDTLLYSEESKLVKVCFGGGRGAKWFGTETFRLILVKEALYY